MTTARPRTAGVFLYLVLTRVLFETGPGDVFERCVFRGVCFSSPLGSGWTDNVDASGLNPAGWRRVRLFKSTQTGFTERDTHTLSYAL